MTDTEARHIVSNIIDLWRLATPDVTIARTLRLPIRLVREIIRQHCGSTHPQERQRVFDFDRQPEMADVSDK